MSKQVNLLFVSFQSNDDKVYAPAVRQKKILNALEQNKINLTCICTSDSKDNYIQRSLLINEAIEKIKKRQIDICYIESPVDAIKRHCDYKLLKELIKNNIPTGYFYRDFHYKFLKSFYNKYSIKEMLYFLYRRYYINKTNKILTKIKIVYFPSSQCFEYFNFKNMKSLPPAGEIHDYQYVNNKTCIYVGGISERYGTNLLLDTFLDLNSESNNYKLILVCRKNEFLPYKSYLKYKWLEVVHADNTNLSEFYNKASVAILPLLQTKYHDFAISFKLFEYMSYSKPIISTNNKAMSNIIKKHDCGIICDDNINSLKKSIKYIFSNDDKLLLKYSKNSYNAVKTTENWNQRIEQIIEDLSNL